MVSESVKAPVSPSTTPALVADVGKAASTVDTLAALGMTGHLGKISGNAHSVHTVTPATTATATVSTPRTVTVETSRPHESAKITTTIERSDNGSRNGNGNAAIYFTSSSEVHQQPHHAHHISSASSKESESLGDPRSHVVKEIHHRCHHQHQHHEQQEHDTLQQQQQVDQSLRIQSRQVERHHHHQNQQLGHPASATTSPANTTTTVSSRDASDYPASERRVSRSVDGFEQKERSRTSTDTQSSSVTEEECSHFVFRQAPPLPNVVSDSNHIDAGTRMRQLLLQRACSTPSQSYSHDGQTPSMSMMMSTSLKLQTHSEYKPHARSSSMSAAYSSVVASHSTQSTASKRVATLSISSATQQLSLDTSSSSSLSWSSTSASSAKTVFQGPDYVKKTPRQGTNGPRKSKSSVKDVSSLNTPPAEPSSRLSNRPKRQFEPLSDIATPSPVGCSKKRKSSVDSVEREFSGLDMFSSASSPCMFLRSSLTDTPLLQPSSSAPRTQQTANFSVLMSPASPFGDPKASANAIANGWKVTKSSAMSQSHSEAMTDSLGVVIEMLPTGKRRRVGMPNRGSLCAMPERQDERETHASSLLPVIFSVDENEQPDEEESAESGSSTLDHNENDMELVKEGKGVAIDCLNRSIRQEIVDLSVKRTILGDSEHRLNGQEDTRSYELLSSSKLSCVEGRQNIAFNPRESEYGTSTPELSNMENEDKLADDDNSDVNEDEDAGLPKLERVVTPFTIPAHFLKNRTDDSSSGVHAGMTTPPSSEGGVSEDMFSESERDSFNDYALDDVVPFLNSLFQVETDLMLRIDPHFFDKIQGISGARLSMWKKIMEWLREVVIDLRQILMSTKGFVSTQVLATSFYLLNQILSTVKVSPSNLQVLGSAVFFVACSQHEAMDNHPSFLDMANLSCETFSVSELELEIHEVICCLRGNINTVTPTTFVHNFMSYFCDEADDGESKFMSTCERILDRVYTEFSFAKYCPSTIAFSVLKLVRKRIMLHRSEAELDASFFEILDDIRNCLPPRYADQRFDTRIILECESKMDALPTF